jgi:hypothetical protein
MLAAVPVQNGTIPDQNGKTLNSVVKNVNAQQYQAEPDYHAMSRTYGTRHCGRCDFLDWPWSEHQRNDIEAEWYRRYKTLGDFNRIFL